MGTKPSLGTLHSHIRAQRGTETFPKTHRHKHWGKSESTWKSDNGVPKGSLRLNLGSNWQCGQILGVQTGRPWPLAKAGPERTTLLLWVPVATSLKRTGDTSPACFRVTMSTEWARVKGRSQQVSQKPDFRGRTSCTLGGPRPQAA